MHLRSFRFYQGSYLISVPLHLRRGLWGAFPSSFSVRLYASNPFLTFWALACGFGSPEVVLFSGAKSLGARILIVPWLLAVLGLVSPLWQAGRSRQFCNLSSRYDWNRKSAARECKACILNSCFQIKTSTPLQGGMSKAEITSL